MPDPNQQGPMSWADLLNQFGGGAGGAGGSQGPSAGGHRGGGEFDMLRTRFAQMSKKAFVVLAVVILIVAAFCYWWFHPPINIHSVDLWMFLAIFVLFPSFWCSSSSTKFMSAEWANARRTKRSLSGSRV